MATFIPHSEWTTSGLIASITRNAMFPAEQQTYLTADFITMMNEVVQSTVVPLIVGYHENYFRKSVLIPLIQNASKALTVGTGNSNGSNVGYKIPADAIGKKLYDVSVMDSNGNQCTLPQTTRWEVGSSASFARGCFIEGDCIFLYPANAFNNDTSLLLDYLCTPMALCDDTGVLGATFASSARIGAVDLTTGNVTLSTTVPGSFTANAAVNFIGSVPQFSTNVVTPIVSISGTVITVDPTTLVDAFGRQLVNVGDWVANAGYSPFLQMPVEARNLVTQATIVKIMGGMKDLDAKKEASDEYEKMAAASMKIFTPRLDDAPKILTSAGRGIGSFRRWSPWGIG